jgi:hypothetical protein
LPTSRHSLPRDVLNIAQFGYGKCGRTKLCLGGTFRTKHPASPPLVFVFTHKTADIATELIVIDGSSSSARVRLTPVQYIYANGVLAAAS